MIRSIKNSELDNQKLSQILTPIDNDLENFDFSKVVVNKPWGFEYLMYSTEKASIWALYIKKGCMTSMHCHIDKKTSLLILSGEAICSTLEGGIKLGKGDGLTLDRKVFHSTQAISDEGVILIEVETPTKKTDVLRLADSYGRESKGYEGQDHMEGESNQHEKIYFRNDEFNVMKKLGEFDFLLKKVYNENFGEILKSKTGEIGVILEGSIMNKLTGEFIEVGDMFHFDDLQNIGDEYGIEQNLVLLRISKNKEFSKKQLKAVLFDFDGVIAKTMEDNFLAWQHAFKMKGANISHEDYMPLEGASLNEIVRIISEKYNLFDLDVAEMIARKEEHFERNHSFSFYSGVLEFINELKSKGIKIAIVTAAHKYRLFSTTPNDFLEKFDTIITGDNFKIGKPEPDPYLAGLNSLEVGSEESIVIENAPLGIKSAKSAGMFCIAISSTLDKNYLKEADVVVDEFKDLRNTDIFRTYCL